MTGERPLRVTRVYLWMRLGGTERQLARVLPRLEARGRVRTRLVLTREGGPLLGPLEEAGIPVEVRRLRGRLRPATIRWLADRLRATGTDLVQGHAHGPSTTSTVAAWGAGPPTPAPVPPPGSISGMRHRLQERLLAPLRAAIVCVSEAVRRDYARATGVSPEKVHVLYNGLDVAAIAGIPRQRQAVRRELGLPVDALLLLCPARLIPDKDHETLLAAFARVAAAHPRAHLALAGEGPLADELRTMVARAGLGSRVHLLGARDDVPRLLRAADMAVLSSRREGFSNVVLEALAAGIPQVVTDVGGNREAMEGSATGRLVPPGDPEAFAAALDELLANAPLRERLGEAAARRARRFDLDRTCADTEALYARILARGPRA